MIHLGVLVFGTLGSVRYVELSRDDTVSPEQLSRQLELFLFGHQDEYVVSVHSELTHAQYVKPCLYGLESLSGVEVYGPFLIGSGVLPHYRTLEFKGRSQQSALKGGRDNQRGRIFRKGFSKH